MATVFICSIFELPKTLDEFLALPRETYDTFEGGRGRRVAHRLREVPMPADRPLPNPDSPLMVAYGAGVNSTAMLVEFARRGIRPDLILFADTGWEKPETYQYLGVVRPFLKSVGFPDLVVVRYRPVRAA